MEFEAKFKSNFFYKKHFDHSLIVSCIFCSIVVIISLLYWKFPDFGALLHLTNFSVFYLFEPWRILTANFIHGDLSHLFSNLYMLFILVILIYRYLGIIVFPLISLVGASLANLVTIYFYDQHIILLGASTLIYFLWGFWFAIYLFGNRRYIFIFRLVRICGIGFIILFPTTFQQNVSYLAHGVGLCIGLIFGAIYFFIQRHFIYSFEEVTHSLVVDYEEYT